MASCSIPASASKTYLFDLVRIDDLNTIRSEELQRLIENQTMPEQHLRRSPRLAAFSSQELRPEKVLLRF
jgi:hypothetical protein